MLFWIATVFAVPQWSWTFTEPRLYHAETLITTPRGFRYLAAENLDARAAKLAMRADLQCTGAAQESGGLVDCSFHDLRIDGMAWKQEEQVALDKILDEWEVQLKAATVEMVFTTDGHLSKFDLKGREGTNQRESEIIEYQRLLLYRLFCLFELPIPEEEKDWTKGWKQKGSPAIFQLMTTKGTAGSSRISHSVSGQDGDDFVIKSEGRAMVSPGSYVEVSSDFIIDVTYGGDASVDPAGVLVFRNMVLDGRLSGVASGVGSGEYYAQQGRLQLVEAFTPME